MRHESTPPTRERNIKQTNNPSHAPTCQIWQNKTHGCWWERLAHVCLQRALSSPTHTRPRERKRRREQIKCPVSSHGNGAAAGCALARERESEVRCWCVSVCVLRAAIPLAEVVFERSVAFQCEARRFLLDDDDDGQRKIRPDRRGWCVKCLSLLWGSNLWKTFGVPGGKKNECLCPVPVAVRNRRPVEVHVSFRRGQITLRRRFERKNGSAREKKEKVTPQATGFGHGWIRPTPVCATY